MAGRFARAVAASRRNAAAAIAESLRGPGGDRPPILPVCGVFCVPAKIGSFTASMALRA